MPTAITCSSTLVCHQAELLSPNLHCHAHTCDWLLQLHECMLIAKVPIATHAPGAGLKHFCKAKPICMLAASSCHLTSTQYPEPPQLLVCPHLALTPIIGPSTHHHARACSHPLLPFGHLQQAPTVKCIHTTSSSYHCHLSHSLFYWNCR